MNEVYTINPVRAATTLGAIFAVFHLLWVVIVAVGAAGVVLAWGQSLHFIQKPYSLMPFDGTAAVIGVVGAFIAGAAIGAVVALIWNALAGKQK